MKKNRFSQKKKRAESKIYGLTERPRLSVFRSNKYIYAQLIDDEKGKTLVSASEKEFTKDTKNGANTKIEKASGVGGLLAKKAVAKKIKKVVFDKGSFKYHGRVKALAEAAREGGLSF